jgi:hypothetical protein
MRRQRSRRPPAAAAAITITLDSTFIRGRDDGKCHLEVRVGAIETETRGRLVFGAVTRAETDITTLIQRTLETGGPDRRHQSERFHRGVSGSAHDPDQRGSNETADFRLVSHRDAFATHEADGYDLSTDNPDRVTAKATLVGEVERLRWRIWNGKAKSAQRSIDRIRKLMHVFKREHSQGAKGVASRKLWHALHAIDKYLRSQAAWLVNYAIRFRAGLRVGTSVTEGTANFLVNRRMNKSQQMRWSRSGADLLLQVRCAAYNGMLGAGFGHRFDRIANANPTFAKAA